MNGDLAPFVVVALISAIVFGLDHRGSGAAGGERAAAAGLVQRSVGQAAWRWWDGYQWGWQTG